MARPTPAKTSEPATPEQSQFVRVRDKGTGHQYTIARSLVNPAKAEVLDKPATGHQGRPLPAKLDPLKTSGDAKPDSAADQVADTTVNA